MHVHSVYFMSIIQTEHNASVRHRTEPTMKQWITNLVMQLLILPNITPSYCHLTHYTISLIDYLLKHILLFI